MGFKKMIIGESMPDKDDPRYKAKYERQVEAGKRFARFLRLDKLAEKMALFAHRNPRVFFFGIFFFLALMFVSSIYRIYTATVYINRPQSTAVEKQEKELRKVLNHPISSHQDSINKKSQ